MVMTESAINEMAVMDLKGDTKVTWDKNRPAEVEAARSAFNNLKAQGYTAHLTKKSGGGTMAEFDPNAEGLTMVMAPVMTAG